MKKDKDSFYAVFAALKEAPTPTAAQKNKMLMEIQKAIPQPLPFASSWLLLAKYPWRTAFGIAAVQSVACTLIFGTDYTNLFLIGIGG